MSTKNLLFTLFGLGLIVFVPACQPERPAALQSIQDPQVRNVLACALEQCGGWAAYSQLLKISYTKRSILLDSLGATESDVTEFHEFTFGNNPVFSIAAVAGNGDTIRYQKDQSGCRKWVNGRPAAADSQVVAQKVNTALYTLLMPWKLLDEGTRLHYAGLDTLPGGIRCHVLEAAYSEGEPWRYYFDEKNCKYRAAWASHGSFGALVLNDSTTTVSGLTLNARRSTWRTRQKQKPLWRRALFYYDDFSLQFN